MSSVFYSFIMLIGSLPLILLFNILITKRINKWILLISVLLLSIISLVTFFLIYWIEQWFNLFLLPFMLIRITASAQVAETPFFSIDNAILIPIILVLYTTIFAMINKKINGGILKNKAN